MHENMPIVHRTNIQTLFADFSQRNKSVLIFGEKVIKFEVKFWFQQRTISNHIDVDNLLMFVMDTLQRARIINNNDSQVVKVNMRKTTGKANKINIKVFHNTRSDSV